MTYNLFIAYKTDEKLNPDGYSKVHEVLEALGSTPQRIHEGLWFILSNNDVKHVFEYLTPHVLQDDSLVVIEGSYFLQTNKGHGMLYDPIRGFVNDDLQP